MSLTKNQVVYAVLSLYYLGAGLHLYHVDYIVVAQCCLYLAVGEKH